MATKMRERSPVTHSGIGYSIVGHDANWGDCMNAASNAGLVTMFGGLTYFCRSTIESFPSKVGRLSAMSFAEG
jgi:hypothetical protein